MISKRYYSTSHTLARPRLKATIYIGALWVIKYIRIISVYHKIRVLWPKDYKVKTIQSMYSGLHNKQYLKMSRCRNVNIKRRQVYLITLQRNACVSCSFDQDRFPSVRMILQMMPYLWITMQYIVKITFKTIRYCYIEAGELCTSVGPYLLYQHLEGK